MKKKNYKKIAENVIELEIKALKKLKKSLNNSFTKAVDAIVKCQSKTILCGVGKSGLIASKIAATLSSVGSPAFALSASDCSHGDLGSISKKDIIILISYSGETHELKNIIQFANRNRIKLIGIVSKKNSTLYKAADIKLHIPEVKEAGLGLVPTASTSIQLAIGDALAVASLKRKNFNRYDFSRLHPSGSLGAQLKTAEDLMITGNKIPFINENQKMESALQIITKKNLGVLIVKNKLGKTTGIITDGQIRRFSQKNKDLQSLKVKEVMTKNPISIDKNTLAAKALSIMNEKKITCLCVTNQKINNKTIGVLHIHSILETNIQ